MKIRDRIIEFRRIPANELQPNPKNWRKHPQAQQDALRGVLSEIGYAGAALAYKTPEGGLRLIDGHLRCETDPQGMIPTLVLDVDDAEAGKLLATFDPLAAMAESDAGKLDELLREVDTGSEALQQMLSELADDAGLYQAPEIVEDEVPEPPVDPVTKPGDLWVMGEHRLLCGDSTKGENWERLGIEKAGALCFTSPPYNLGNSVKLSGNKAKSKDGNSYESYDDCGSAADWRKLVDSLLDNALQFCDAAIFNVQPLAGNRKQIWKLMSDRADQLCDVITWDKGHAQPPMAAGVVSSRYEWLCVFVQKNASRKIPLSSWRGTVANVYAAPPQRDNEFSKVHAATFPVHLPSFAISTLCNLTKLVIDCCCGTGTTIIAAEQLGRRCYGLELDPAYCDVIVQRWEKLTGKKAELEVRPDGP